MRNANHIVNQKIALMQIRQIILLCYLQIMRRVLNNCILNQMTQVTDPLGNIRQPFTYTAREYDYATGMYFYRARYYDPKVGRFVTKDPIGFEGGDVNLYVYAGNNPMNNTDPSGLATYIGKASCYNLVGFTRADGGEFDPNEVAGAITGEKVKKLLTTVTVTCNCKKVQVTINDRGPFARGPDKKPLRPLRPHPKRVIDLTPAAFRECGMNTCDGIIDVTVEVPG